MAMLNPNCLTLKTPQTTTKPTLPTKPSLSLQTLPKPLSLNNLTSLQASLGATMAGALFSTISCCDSAMAAQQIADLAESDNRGLALLIPLIPAIAWVLFNILRPALNQIDRMRSSKGVIVGLGLGAGVYGLLGESSAKASEIAQIADASSDNRGQLLLFVITPAVLWVLYNILQPALNQINRMRSE
ncbi:hypothetical protein AMTR_s00049p00157390 [Amborella trichopoda]|uniref:Photosystem II core complex proteins psbY, chloroplastic n=2 Tax=Amborella trichopoda TaxID=13333 RepID=W1PUM5_AMBTC|nr:hypothetical protein AMTR_s00049p00157390 [Amborella trichopoda]